MFASAMICLIVAAVTEFVPARELPEKAAGYLSAAATKLGLKSKKSAVSEPTSFLPVFADRDWSVYDTPTIFRR